MSTGSVSDPGSVSAPEGSEGGPALSPVRQEGGAPPVPSPVPAITEPGVTPWAAPAPVRPAGGDRAVTNTAPGTPSARTARRYASAKMVRRI